MQYIAELKLPPDFNDTSPKSIQRLVDDINKFIAGSIIQGNSSVFFIKLLDADSRYL